MNRRSFLRATAATWTAFASVPKARSDPGSETTAPPTPFVLDCQSHLYCPEVLSLLEKRTDDPLVYRKDGQQVVKMGDWHRKVLPNHTSVEAKLAAMDANGITMTALSVNDPGPEWFGDDGPRLARVMNDFVAAIVRKHPTRFLGLCVLPLQDMDAAQAELNRCVHDLNMRGILLYTNLAGRFPDEPAFRPLFARAEALGIPLLLHPAKPLTTEIAKDYEMTSSLGNMFEDTTALTRIIMSGILDKHPRLRLVCPHLGGTLPYIIGRIDHQISVLKRGPQYLTRRPSEYLRQVWFDIVSPLPQAIKFCHELLGSERLLFASDHPWVDPALIRECLAQAGLPAVDQEKILGENARQLFDLNA